MLHDRAAKAVVQNVIFNRADDVNAASEEFQSAGVHRFDPPWIDKGNGNPFFFQLARGFFCDFKHVAQAEDRHVASVLHHLCLANLEELRFRFEDRKSTRLNSSHEWISYAV